ncbi:MAG: hypothetical protein ACK44D_02620 [Bacteroidia bacterium]
MKINYNLLICLFSFITLVSISSCIKPVEPTPQPPKQTPCDTCLPPITKPGVACKINGKPFISKFERRWAWVATRFDYYEQHLSISAYDYETDEVFGIGLGPIIDTGVYIFPNSVLTRTGSGYYDYRGIAFNYSAEPIQIGHVHLLRLDSIKGSIQGTFEFDLYTKDLMDTIHVTEGRFFLNK